MKEKLRAYNPYQEQRLYRFAYVIAMLNWVEQSLDIEEADSIPGYEQSIFSYHSTKGENVTFQVYPDLVEGLRNISLCLWKDLVGEGMKEEAFEVIKEAGKL